jgi:adenylosuccinate synthase
MKIDLILGLQWGDEGKGKIVDYLAESYDIVARFQGGPNAGHTLKFDGKKFVLHTVPSGIFRPNLLNVIGNGVVIDPITLEKELKGLHETGYEFENRLFVAKKAHLILPTHRLLDAVSEAVKGKEKIGSTLKGIGPTYMDKTGRNGLRVGDILLPNFREKYRKLRQKHLDMIMGYAPSVVRSVNFDLDAEEAKWHKSLTTLKTLQIIDGEYFINKALQQGKKILAEGAQGSMLDIDFGTYPFVTSSNTITAGVCSGLGVPPSAIGEVIGVTKAYCTRVGSGPFPTELHDEMGEFIRNEGAEFGSTTGRARRCGWLDLVQLHYTCMLNGVTQLCMTKVDVLDKIKTINIATKYRYDNAESLEIPYDMATTQVTPLYEGFDGWKQSLDGISNYETLPTEVQNYVTVIEQYLGIKMTMISTGPEREKLIIR